MTARWRAVALPAALVLVAGCDGPGVVSPRTRLVGQVGGNTASTAALVGTWRRIVFFVDDFGIARSSETSWRFAADGSVVRVQVTRNLTFGLADAIVSAGRFRYDGTSVSIDFLTPVPLQLTYAARRVGAALELAGESYFPVDG